MELHQFEARASSDEVKTDLELTCTVCSTVLCDIEADDNLGTLVSVAEKHVCVTATCRRCGRTIYYNPTDGWIDPEATGDDSIWRETCDENHEDRIAAHEPK